MADGRANLEVGIDPSPAQAGARVVKRSFDEIRQANKDVTATLKEHTNQF